MIRANWNKVARYAIAPTLVIAFCVTLTLLEQARDEAEFADVVSAYLQEQFLRDVHDWGRGRDIRLVLQSEPQVPGRFVMRWMFIFDKRMTFRESSLVTRSSFAVTNALPWRFGMSLRMPSGVSFVIANKVTLEDPSTDFQKLFPGNLGYIAISRAGFNWSKTEAIFYIDHICGLCGGGRYVLMQKRDGVWKTTGEHYTWIS